MIIFPSQIVCNERWIRLELLHDTVRSNRALTDEFDTIKLLVAIISFLLIFFPTIFFAAVDVNPWRPRS